MRWTDLNFLNDLNTSCTSSRGKQEYLHQIFLKSTHQRWLINKPTERLFAYQKTWNTCHVKMVSKIFSGANCPIMFSVRLTKPESLIQAFTAPFLSAEHQETTERSYGDINLFCPLFPEINPYVLTQAFTSSHDTPRQRNLRHLNSALKEVERVILKRLHHLFFSPSRSPSRRPVGESVFIPISL